MPKRLQDLQLRVQLLNLTGFPLRPCQIVTDMRTCNRSTNILIFHILLLPENEK